MSFLALSSMEKRHLGFRRFQSRVNLDSPFCSLFHQGKDISKHVLCFTPNTILAVIKNKLCQKFQHVF